MQFHSLLCVTVSCILLLLNNVVLFFRKKCNIELFVLDCCELYVLSDALPRNGNTYFGVLAVTALAVQET
jgi:hypothetical protein